MLEETCWDSVLGIITRNRDARLSVFWVDVFELTLGSVAQRERSEEIGNGISKI